MTESLPEQESAFKQSIETLPIWAQVALAARCARRIQPLAVHDWPDAPRGHLANIEKAITSAESAASDPMHASIDAEVARKASARVIEIHAEEFGLSDSAIRSVPVLAVINFAADSAYLASRGAASDPDLLTLAVTGAIEAAIFAAYRVSHESGGSTLDGIQRDLQYLNLLVSKGSIESESQVEPDIFKQMWYGDPPVGFLAAA